MAKRKTLPSAAAALPIAGRDLPLCLVRPILATARQATPDFPESLARAVLAAMSLNIAEKHQLFTTSLCGFQITELARVFSEEREHFGALLPESPFDLLTLQARNVMENFLLVASYGHGIPVRIERALIARMVRRYLRKGLHTTLAAVPERWWADDAPVITAVVWRALFPPSHAAHARARMAEPDPFSEAI